ncbi:MAG: hypothetical protein CM15mP31_3080 [Gammaproteobacteria bacterium]|nr:MAG: hypothetical protein CM15mP31_3080 [Gammaproteobacteria bacterium]
MTKFLISLLIASLQKIGHRAVVLKTIAGSNGAGMLMHLKSLRAMKTDMGKHIRNLAEAKNERMHLIFLSKLQNQTYLKKFLC